MDDKTLLHAIDRRISRRSYTPETLSAKDKAALQSVIGQYAQSGFRMEIVEASLKASYGLFSGVRNYILMIADEADPNAEEKLGYFGELVVLAATDMGLGTCWMGMYNPKSCPIALKENERVAIAVTVGYIDKPKFKEKLIRGVVHRKSKSAAQLFVTDSAPPDWFTFGVSAAAKAPSAVNRQPVTFYYKNGVVTASVKDINAGAMAIDLGIAKAHFSLATGGVWEWGNGGAAAMKS